MQRSASLVVDGVDGGVVVQQDLHARGALRVVGVRDAVVERRQAARVLVVRRRTERQQRLVVYTQTQTNAAA